METLTKECPFLEIVLLQVQKMGILAHYFEDLCFF
jgi:hypothetical protein